LVVSLVIGRVRREVTERFREPERELPLLSIGLNGRRRRPIPVARRRDEDVGREENDELTGGTESRSSSSRWGDVDVVAEDFSADGVESRVLERLFRFVVVVFLRPVEGSITEKVSQRLLKRWHTPFSAEGHESSDALQDGGALLEGDFDGALEFDGGRGGGRVVSREGEGGAEEERAVE
jgi:hypothetical protein